MRAPGALGQGRPAPGMPCGEGDVEATGAVDDPTPSLLAGTPGDFVPPGGDPGSTGVPDVHNDRVGGPLWRLGACVHRR